MPKRMSLVDEEPWHTKGIRKAVVKNFLIYFWVDDANKKVQVFNIVFAQAVENNM
ncbi:hypothetical protein [Blautia liquoris]|nr:hypothetical protein [Blautia liquoris]